MSHLQLTVTEFNQVMADIVHHQLQLNKLCISGEISQLNYYSNNTHLYLTLIHKSASLQCVIYNQHLKQLPLIKKGDQIQIIGQCRFLKNKGQLIFSGVNIIPDGKGSQSLESQRLFKELSNAGYFNKKTIELLPTHIEKVCIITANESAAYHDINTIISHSDHTFDTLFIPSSVQGLLAPNELLNALTIAESLSPDVICISRGGGADQDFACFNDEALCKKVATLKIPVITGIGHQINKTLCCYSANQDFETPTAMAQFLCLHSMTPFQTCLNELSELKTHFHYQLNQLDQQLDSQKQLMHHMINANLREQDLVFKDLNSQLLTLNPIKKLSNGFIYAETNTKTPISSIQQIATHDTIDITLVDGAAKATINHVLKRSN